MKAHEPLGILEPKLTRRKPRGLLKAIAGSAAVRGMQHWRGPDYLPCKTLIYYGWGGQVQQKAIEAHEGNYVGFDLGYWLRDGYTFRHWRVSINGFHCPQLIMRGESPGGSRFLQAKIPVLKQHKTDGHILLIGNAPKSNKVLSAGWSQKKLRQIRREFPGQKILYRSKPGRPNELGVRHDGLADGAIDDELRRASLVVCRHSNVAVDACRLGVPVVCEDGAGAAIYPRKLKDYQKQPSHDERVEFLHRLAWWQWNIAEIRQGKMWDWLGRQLDDLP